MDSIIIEIIQSDLKKYEKLSNILKYVFVDIAEIDQSKYYLLGSYAIRKYRPINDLDINLDYGANNFEELLSINTILNNSNVPIIILNKYALENLYNININF